MDGNDEFHAVRRMLHERAHDSAERPYFVPEILLGGSSAERLVDVRNPYRFFSDVFDRIAAGTGTSGLSNTALSASDCIYQSFMRSFAALNGEIGTPLKQIAFLPFLRKKLGVTLFISLPTGAIGRTNRKGARGSPFAVRNPFDVDGSLADDLLPGVSARMQYKALVQACKLMGMRPGSIVPLTILSMDCPAFKIFPELGFWWTAPIGERLFADPPQLLAASEGPRPHGVIDIGHEARQKFCDPPEPGELVVEFHEEQGYFVGRRANGPHEPLTLANAFPDPVVRDASSYTWSDVATVRYTQGPIPPAQGLSHALAYDPSSPAWSIMPHVLAWRAIALGEEVFLIDVNQCVPEPVLARARAIVERPPERYTAQVERLLAPGIEREEAEAILCDLERPAPACSGQGGSKRVELIAEELWNFDNVSDSVDAIVGPLIFCVSAHSHCQRTLVRSLRHHLRVLERNTPSKPYLGGVGNHDTRPPNPELSALLYATYSLLPNGVPMIFSGTEFGAQLITNKEFGFSSDDLVRFKHDFVDSRLGLFNDLPLNWEGLPRPKKSSSQPWISPALIAEVNSLRRTVYATFSDWEFDYRFIEATNGKVDACFGYERTRRADNADSLIVLTNWDADEYATIMCPRGPGTVLLQIGRRLALAGIPREGWLTLPPRSMTILATGACAALVPKAHETQSDGLVMANQ